MSPAARKWEVSARIAAHVLMVYMYVFIGGGKVEMLRCTDFVLYYGRRNPLFLVKVSSRAHITYPSPLESYDFCHWQDICIQRWAFDWLTELSCKVPKSTDPKGIGKERCAIDWMGVCGPCAPEPPPLWLRTGMLIKRTERNSASGNIVTGEEGFGA